MRLINADDIHYCMYDLDNYFSFSAVTDDEIAEMPTIDAMLVVHGKWIKYITCYRCSICGYQVTGVSNFCPDCAAKMDLED